MSTVFISYKRENETAVKRLVEALREAGLHVWWDQDIAADAPWEATIERELNAAKVVIVAWSEAAVASDNVKAEARRARNTGKLIQVFIEKCEPPLFFGERQGVDLSNWNGAAADNRFQAVLTAARAIESGKHPPAGVGYSPRKRAPWGAVTALFICVSAVLGFVSNLGGARDAVCGLSAINQTCFDWGLMPTQPATTDPIEMTSEARQQLLESVVGVWGRQDRACIDVVRYSVARGDDGIDRITATGTGFQGVSQVIAAENGVIVSRDAAPSASGGREQWEFRPDGDRLTLYDKDGVATTLARCDRE
ncbi:MAG: toll/interleukin-1 receptor domain-containing protein [Hyphomonadaceae bacterium]